MGWVEVLGRGEEGPGSSMTVGRASSARAQLSLRLAKLLRLSGEEGKREGEVGVPGIVAGLGMSSTADEEEDWVWSVSTDICFDAVAKEGQVERHQSERTSENVSESHLSSDQAPRSSMHQHLTARPRPYLSPTHASPHLRSTNPLTSHFADQN